MKFFMSMAMFLLTLGPFYDRKPTMLTHLHCIALRTVKYSDRNNILTAYSREMGRVALLMSAGGSREAVRRRAVTMPLTPFECIADVRPGRDIYNVREPRALLPLHGLHSNPVKGAVAMFMAELLGAVLTESQEDAALYAFLVDSVGRFDSMSRGVANFHLAFLYRLGRYIGIEPDVSTYAPGRVFDMVDGTFRSAPPLHRRFLPPEDAATVALLSRMTWDNLAAFRFSRNQRNSILTAILEYYTLHYAALSGLNSLDVMRRLFD